MSNTRKFGDYEVTLLQDGVFETTAEILAHADGPAALQAVTDRLAGEKLRLDVNCFLLRGPDGIALLDAGAGNAWGPALGHARGALAEAGIEAGQITRVLLTHLHGDHVLGLLDGDKPWLPHAEILLPEAEFVYFTDPAIRAALPQDKQQSFDVAAQVLAAYAGKLHTISPGPVPGMPKIELVALPGPTPGHGGYKLHGPETLLIWADTLHLRELQTADPKICMAFDVDPAQALQTRLETLQQAEREGWTVAGSHVAGFGNIQRDGEVYRFVVVA